MSVTVHTRSRTSSRPRTSATPNLPWFALVAGFVAGVGVCALLLLMFGGGGASPQTAAPERPVTGQSLYASGKAGAVAAATSFEKAFLLADLRDPDEARAQIMAQVSKAGAPGIARQLEEVLGGQSESPLYAAKLAGDPYLADVVPLKFVVTGISEKSAVVAVWSATISGIFGKAVPRIAYAHDEITLVREGGSPAGATWRVAKYRNLLPVVPYVSVAQKTSDENDIYQALEGGELYEQAP